MMQNTLTERAPRLALMKLLDSLTDKRVIFLSAPAGFGKTISTQLWIAHREIQEKIRHKTVSLDEYDNNSAVFCSRFIAALASLQPENAALRGLAGNLAYVSAPVEFALRSLSALTEEQIPSFLVFDDLHVISRHEILKQLFIFVNRLPNNFTVLLLSREAPPDSFSEMVFKDHFSVVDSGYLQFTCEEIRSFFHNNKTYITEDQADEIFKSTGGWALGIRTLLLSDSQSYGRKLTGHRLGAFLKNHVWSRWSVQYRRFMTLVSVAEELTLELCEWLTADDETLKTPQIEEILTELAGEKAYLRLTGPKTYRFHDLFRDFLLQMLKESSEETVQRQLIKAGAYFIQAKEYHRAAEYYKKGANDDGVVNALNHLYDYNCVGASIKDTLMTIRSVVSDSVLQKDPFLFEALWWSAFVEGRADKFEEYADQYYQLYPQIASRDTRSAVSFAFLYCLDYRMGLIRAYEIVSAFAPSGEARVASATLTHNMPVFHRSNRDFSEMLLDTEKSMIAADRSIGLLIGRQYRVLRECLLSGFLYERGQLNEAYEHALAACSNITDDCSAEIRFCALMILASVLAAVGNTEDLAGIIDKAEYMIEQYNAFYLSANLRAFQYRLRLADGDKAAAREWIKDNNRDLFDILSFFEIYQHFTTARAYISVGNYTDAALILQKLLKLSERYRRPLDIIGSRILLAVVYWKSRQSRQSLALEHLRQAVAIASEYGYTQLFENEGAELVNILHRLQKSAAQKKETEETHRRFIRTLYIAAASGAKRHKGLTGGTMPENTTFTEKQKTVMRLLSDGLERNEIADRMGIKPYAVKSHIELIYKKLDVSNRTDAIVKIREFGVISREG